jgi:glycosyltransferase involved in cell wall biosynthesis
MISAVEQQHIRSSSRGHCLILKKVLIVAFHFPPFGGGSGFLRTLKFCRDLSEFGWQPVVLTVQSKAYERIDPSQLSQIPANVPVLRPFGLDTRKHLSFGGRYPLWLALPDRWVSWCLSAIPTGLFAIRKHQIDLILTTFPIATAVLIGLILHWLTGKPWVVDFRDSMTEDNYPRDPFTRRIWRWIESQAVKHSSRLVFTASSAVRMYLSRYPELRPEKCLLIPNGYDEEDFKDLASAPFRTNHVDRPIRLLHLGLLYPEERNPLPFFKALSRLKNNGLVNPASLRICLRAPGSEDLYAEIIRQQGIENLVELLPPLPYRQALREAANVDGLLLFQGVCCDHQIPAKAYEYLRLGKPILALTSETGDTAALLRETGGATLVHLADEDAIYRAVPVFLRSVQQQAHSLPDAAKARRYSRRSQAEQLAKCLSEAVSALETPSMA